MRFVQWFAIVLLLGSIGYSQNQEDSLGSVEGTVTNSVTSQPVKGAQVSLLALSGCKPQTPMATTDSGGHFLFSGVTAGTCRLHADAKGYVGNAYGAAGQNDPGSTLTLKPAQHLSGLAIALAPLGVIRGRVLDSDGDPVERCQVQAMKVNGNRNRPLALSSEQTDDRGEYRVFGLAPGNYLVLASCNAPAMNDVTVLTPPGQSEAAPKDELAYVPTYFPNAVDAKQAMPVPVKPGDEVPIDITVSKQKTVHVRGVVAGEPSNNPVFALLFPRDNPIPQAPKNAAVAEGKFDIPGVLPGSYLLVVSSQAPGEERRMTREDVEVGPAGIDGLLLSLSSASKIKGTIRVEGGITAKTNLSTLMVLLQPAKARMFGLDSSVGRVDATGNFEISELPPGDYVVGITANSNDFRDWYTKSVNYSGRDVTDSGIHIGARTIGATLDLVVSPRGASVDGTVLDSNHQPVRNMPVMAIPDANRRRRFDLYDVAQTDEQGRFQLRGLGAGDYTIVADQDIQLDDRFDSDAVNGYEQNGTSVHLEDAGHKTIQLNAATSAVSQ